MTEIHNAVSSFGILQAWDEKQSSEAGIMIKVKVEELRDIPASIVLSGKENILGESWSCPIVIVQQNLIREGPPDEEPVPPNGNPHPMPENENFHPNQHVFIGPFLQHPQVVIDNMDENIQ